ncbi:hypothetical protein SLE2022_354550 [Rubroshorea leprosula]
MSSFQEKRELSDDEENCLRAMQLANATVIPLVLKSAIDLDLLEIMAKASLEGRKLSSAEIASHLQAQNPDAISVIDRMLCLLASHSILTCTLVTDMEGRSHRVYGLAPVGKYFLQNEDRISFAPLLQFQMEKYSIDHWCYLKEAVIDGGVPFEKAHGMPVFEYAEKDEKMNNVFNKIMSNISSLVMNKVLETYKGFEGLEQLVDVGGGVGTTLKSIVSKYRQIKGINFDLPHVIKNGSPFPGVEFIGGDMFTKVPQGQTIILKWILHNWDDDHCLKLLKNCYDALPDSGKVVVMEFLAPESPVSDLIDKIVFELDIRMFQSFSGAKERTKKEYEALAREAGFSALKQICPAYNFWVMEFYKNMNPSA